MGQKRFPKGFKIGAVHQRIEWGQPVTEVSARLGVCTHSLYKWMKEQLLGHGGDRAGPDVGKRVQHAPGFIGHLKIRAQQKVAEH